MNRADIDNLAIVLVNHDLAHCLAHVIDAAQVNMEVAFPLLVGLVHDHFVATHTGGIDEDVDTPVSCHDLFDGLGDAVVIAHVASGIHRIDAELLLYRGDIVLEAILAPCKQGYLCSLTCVRTRNLQSKT